MHDFIEEIPRRNELFRLANDLQAHLVNRTLEEGMPGPMDLARHHMKKIGEQANRLSGMAPFSSEFLVWYYGQDLETTAWCKDTAQILSRRYHDPIFLGIDPKQETPQRKTDG